MTFGGEGRIQRLLFLFPLHVCVCVSMYVSVIEGPGINLVKSIKRGMLMRYVCGGSMNSMDEVCFLTCSNLSQHLIIMVWYKDELQRVFKLKTFPNLHAALAYQEHANSERARAGRAPLFIFSREVSANGHRYFFVEHPNDFYD